MCGTKISKSSRTWYEQPKDCWPTAILKLCFQCSFSYNYFSFVPFFISFHLISFAYNNFHVLYLCLSRSRFFFSTSNSFRIMFFVRFFSLYSTSTLGFERELRTDMQWWCLYLFMCECRCSLDITVISSRDYKNNSSFLPFLNSFVLCSCFVWPPRWLYLYTTYQTVSFHVSFSQIFFFFFIVCLQHVRIYFYHVKRSYWLISSSPKEYTIHNTHTESESQFFFLFFFLSLFFPFHSVR